MNTCAVCGKITMDGGVLIPNGFGLVNVCVPCAVKRMEAMAHPQDEPQAQEVAI